jgi:uncharacterized protein
MTRHAVAGRRELVAFRLAVAVVALHVIDDNFLQPPPGTSAGDHLVSGLVPLAALGLAAWAYPQLRGGARASMALVLGVLGIAAGIEAAHYTTTVGASGDDFTGLLALAAGVALLGLGVATLWRSRRTDDTPGWRYPRRLLIAAGGAIAAYFVVLPIGAAYIFTHTARAGVPTNRLGVASEDVRVRTGDGLELQGWYVPSRNRAAVIAFPGRKGPQRPARLLARHGYGVLLLDRRGEGASEGAPNAFGWGGKKDIQAAVGFLAHRAEVDPGRIGGIGLSVGGEMMLEAAAETPALRAVVSEGAGARSFTENMDHDMGAVEKGLGVLPNATMTASVAVLSNGTPPANLKDLVGRIAPRPLLLIAAPHSPNGEDLNRGYFAAAGAPKALWEIPESGHVGGLDARPREYERRVTRFFDEALLRLDGGKR